MGIYNKIRGNYSCNEDSLLNKIIKIDYKVGGIDGATTIADFYSNITPYTGATAVLVDKDGNEKTSGDVESSDLIKVTSLDGKIVVTYSISPLTATEIVETNNIELYPNRTNGN